MDEIVKQAMAKWPKVPHCYGWLALDARGAWRMRDERSQTLNLLGDKIVHTALVGFINRNYLHDDQGRWYFQNGPQRVYVNLEATPYIAHTDPAHGLVLHTGEALCAIDAAWMTENGQLVFRSGEKIALIDDRDMAQCMAQLRMNGKTVDDDELLEWLSNTSDANQLALFYQGKSVPVLRIQYDKLASTLGFVTEPQPD
ncbi:MAG TPA: DUF2946 family protein [Burkholderiaceae bacterium]|jgi:hypothetical protein